METKNTTENANIPWDVYYEKVRSGVVVPDEAAILFYTEQLRRNTGERKELLQKLMAGEEAAKKEYIESFVPVMLHAMRQRSGRIGFPAEVIVTVITDLEKYTDNYPWEDRGRPDYEIGKRVDWATRNACTRYIAEHPELMDGQEADTGERRRIAFFEENRSEEEKEEIISQWLRNMTERERKLISYRFGLDGGERKTLEEVGRILGISRDRARQIENKLLRRLLSSGRTPGEE